MKEQKNSRSNSFLIKNIQVAPDGALSYPLISLTTNSSLLSELNSGSPVRDNLFIEDQKKKEAKPQRGDLLLIIRMNKFKMTHCPRTAD